MLTFGHKELLSSLAYCRRGMAEKAETYSKPIDGQDLSNIFCFEEERTVRKDFVIQFKTRLF